MSTHEFSIPVSELDAAGKPYRFPVRASWMRGALEDNEATAAGTDGELDVRLSKSGNDVVVHGTLRAELTVPCARCLKDVTVSIDQPLTALLVPRNEARLNPEGEHELSAADADVLPYDGDTVVLDDLVRDELVLEIPMIPLCSEDCPGMSPPREERREDDAGAAGSSGKPLDPRLAPLLRFQKLHVLDKDKKE